MYFVLRLLGVGGGGGWEGEGLEKQEESSGLCSYHCSFQVD